MGEGCWNSSTQQEFTNDKDSSGCTYGYWEVWEQRWSYCLLSRHECYCSREISQCEICNECMKQNAKEPLKMYEKAVQPWSKVGIGLLEWKANYYLLWEGCWAHVFFKGATVQTRVTGNMQLFYWHYCVSQFYVLVSLNFCLLVVGSIAEMPRRLKV